MKTKRSGRYIPSMDRISFLPDEVLCHILSFLPTRRSVQTSVLSKRWCFLWSNVPSLEFYLHPDDPEDTLNSKIISNIVLQHNHDIHTFILRVFNRHFDASEEEFESWIVNITARNICHLDIHLGNQFVLPRCIFTCKTLVYLSLGFSKYIPKSGICLPVLKKLQLTHVGYESHESFARLISACPMLEELSIDGEVFGHCCVSSPTLTRLDLKSEIDFGPGFWDFGVKLDTPALKYLSLYCSMPNEFLVGPLDSLIEADITLHWEDELQDNFIYSRNVLSFVGQLYNAKLLKLSTRRVELIHDTLFSNFGVKFHNLTELKLELDFDLNEYSNLGYVTSFLENANNLQVLCLRMDGILDQYYWMEPKRVPKCLISHLRKVNIFYFGCSENEFDMVRYILKNAKVLKRMEIHTHPRDKDLKRKFKAVKRLALFERRSKKCQLVFD